MDRESVINWIIMNGINNDYIGSIELPSELVEIVSEVCQDAIIVFNDKVEYMIVNHVPYSIDYEDIRPNIGNIIKIVQYNSLSSSYVTEGVLNDCVKSIDGDGKVKYELDINI